MPVPLDLPDINVWMAISFEQHPLHDRARRYWTVEAGERQVFCRVTALGFLRLCTNTFVMGGQPLAPAQAWDFYRSLRRLPEVSFADEPANCETIMQAWVTGSSFLPRLWTDAYLAAFAQASSLRLVSFDRDFSRFLRLDWHLLE